MKKQFHLIKSELRRLGFRPILRFGNQDGLTTVFRKLFMNMNRVVFARVDDEGVHSAWYAIGNVIYPVPEPAAGTSPIGFTTVDEIAKAVSYLSSCMVHAPSEQELEDRELQRIAWASVHGNPLTGVEQRRLARYCFYDLEERGLGMPQLVYRDIGTDATYRRDL